MDKKDPNYSEEGASPLSYYDPQGLNIVKFYEDLGLERENSIIVSMACELIERETDTIDTEVADLHTLQSSKIFLAQKGHDLMDNTFAQHVNVIRILKNIPAIHGELTDIQDETHEDIVKVLQLDIQNLTLDPRFAYLRESITSHSGISMTREEYRRGYSISTNGQKHISEEEMGKVVLPIVAKLFNSYYLVKAKNEIERR